MSRLPYFDLILERLEAGDSDFVQAFGRHVHWGFWEDPHEADGSLEDLGRATERMCRLVCDAGSPGSARDILDVGCGFGGTVASLLERFPEARVAGLNIDERQLARAREQVKGAEFVCGDACAMPFEADSFDLVLAVECIFHFPSRRRFFQEAARVLRPGGRLVVSDFVVGARPDPGLPEVAVLQERFERFYGRAEVGVLEEYRQLACEVGMELSRAADVTRGTVPAYVVGGRLLGRVSEEGAWATAMLEQEARLGTTRYLVMRFDFSGL